MNRSRTLALLAKRSIDRIGAAAIGLLLLPLMAVTALAIWAAMGPPVLFRHTRPGLKGKLFTLIKFRTMSAPRSDQVWYLTDAQRITRLGRFLRATSLDELPELWNVLRGEMSLVGPRPLLIEYLDQYSAEERRRHDVRPGITGWAAVNGRHALRFRERLKLDVWYVDHWSLWLDVAETQDVERIGFPLPSVGGCESPGPEAGGAALGSLEPGRRREHCDQGLSRPPP